MRVPFALTLWQTWHSPFGFDGMTTVGVPPGRRRRTAPLLFAIGESYEL